MRLAFGIAALAGVAVTVILLVGSLASGSSRNAVSPPAFRSFPLTRTVLDQIRKGDSEGRVVGLLGSDFTVLHEGSTVVWRYAPQSAGFPADVLFRNDRVVGMTRNPEMFDQRASRVSQVGLLPCVWQQGMVAGCGSILRR